MPGLRRRLEGEGRVKVTEMIKVFLFLVIGKFGKYKCIWKFCDTLIFRNWWSTARVQCWPRSLDCQTRKDKFSRWYDEQTSLKQLLSIFCRAKSFNPSQKISGLGNQGLGVGVGGINFRSQFFLVSSEIRQVCDDKTA